MMDVFSGSSAYCGIGSGCEAVGRATAAVIGPFALPVLGLLGLGTLYLGLDTGGRARHPRAFRALSLLGGAAALVLLAVQALWIGRFCSLCVVVDLSALLVATLASGARLDPDPMARWSGWTLLLLALLAPLGWPLVRQTPAPSSLLASYQRSGHITVIEFTDFHCPFCRRAHPKIQAALESFGDRIHFVRLLTPLSEKMGSAMNAARAAHCAAQQGREDAMADTLFVTNDLSVDGCRKLAARVGMDPSAHDRCVQDPDTDASIHKNVQLLRRLGFVGLPTVYVGGERLVGARSEQVYRAAIERAAGTTLGVRGRTYFAVALILFLSIAILGYEVEAKQAS